MNIVFVLNNLSPHQLPYITKLTLLNDVKNVTIVVPEIIAENRMLLGWEIDECVNDVNVIVSPTISVLQQLFGNDNTTALFSGITSFEFVHRAFLISLECKNIQRGLIVEGPFTYKWPVCFHKVRFFLQDRKFIPNIDFVFAIGKAAIDYYKSLSNHWKVIPFSYCTEAPLSISDKKEAKFEQRIKFLYVGSLIHRKNVKLLIDSFVAVKTKNNNLSLDIIGGGVDRVKLESVVTQYHCEEQIHFHGVLPMSQVRKEIAEYDVLVLPSRHDGWGAVVNEALQQGLYVLVSDKCGSQILLENSDLGLIFKSGCRKDLTLKLGDIIERSEYIQNTRELRQEWASVNISGESLAQHMFDAIRNK